MTLVTRGECAVGSATMLGVVVYTGEDGWRERRLLRNASVSACSICQTCLSFEPLNTRCRISHHAWCRATFTVVLWV